MVVFQVEGAVPVRGEFIRGAFTGVNATKKFKAGGFFNFNRIVFRATSNTAQLIISDETATVGQEVTLNFIEVEPYLMPD